MNKHQLAKALSTYMGWTQKKSLLFITNTFDWILSQLTQGHKVTLSGFGSFYQSIRGERRLLHPKTGEAIVLKERVAPQFTPSSRITELINQGGSQ